MPATWQQLAYKADVLPALLSPYAVGDLIYANTTTTLAKLADVAVGSYLASGGIGVAPAWATLNQAAVAGLTTADGPSFAHLHLADLAAIYTAAESWIGPSSTAGIYFKGGNVGIGTTAPGFLLEVGTFNTTNSNIKTGSLEFQPYCLNNAFIAENCYYNSGWKYRSTGYAGLFYFNTGEGQFRFFASGTSGDPLPGAAAGAPTQFKVNSDGSVALGGTIDCVPGTYTGASVLITSTGNVGIGTTSPGEKLEVAGNVLVQENNKIGFRYSAGDPGPYQYITANGVTAMQFYNSYTGAATAKNYSFFGSSLNNEIVTILGGGNVGIGTTSPGTKLHISTGIADGGFRMTTPDYSVGVAGSLFQISHSVDSGNGYVDIRQLVAGAGSWGNIVMQAGGGNVGIGTTAPTNLLSLGGNAARIFWMERHTTANTAGNSLTVQAGGATVAATDKAGGQLILLPGLSTGSAESGVTIRGCLAGGAGTGDNSLQDMIKVLGNKLGFFNVTPVVRATELTDELTTITHTAPGTPDYALQDLVQNTGFGFVTKDEGNSVLAVIANLQTRQNEIETKLTAYGLLIDAD